MRRVVEFLILCAASVLASGALAAEAPTTADVLSKIHQANQLEMDRGRMAIQVGNTREVRRLGRTVVNDHLAIEKKVARLAKDERIELADTTVAGNQDGLPTGDAFDATFVRTMLSTHRQSIAELEDARAVTTDEKLKKLIDEILPVLQRHEDAARRLVDQANRS
jgi:predicted outer membrane protein